MLGILLSIAIFIFTAEAIPQQSSKTVRPIRDDVGFCWDAKQMQRLVDYLKNNEKIKPLPSSPVAAISPHDDYLYAGAVYYPLFASIRTKEVVIIGLTHGSVRRQIGDPKNILILDEFDQWQGLSKPINPSPLREIIKAKLNEQDFLISNKAHQLEHSIEALLPWLQYFNPDITITPIMVTAMPFERMQTLTRQLAEIIINYMQDRNLQFGSDLMILISSDANHYGPDFANTPFGEDQRAHEKGTSEDRRVAQTYLTGSITEEKIAALTKEICNDDEQKTKTLLWCGRYAIPFGLLLAHHTLIKLQARILTGRLLRYADTYSEGIIPLKKTGMGITAPFSLKHWVGFFSAIYY